MSSNTTDRSGPRVGCYAVGDLDDSFVRATLTHWHVALPVGEYTGTLRQPIMSVDVKRPVKINMIKINLSGAAEDGKPQQGVEWSNLAFRT
jgi:hypothetical protein